MGKKRCAGLMVFNCRKMGKFFELALKTKESGKLEKTINDQILLRNVADNYPEILGDLSQPWDTHLADGAYKYRNQICEKLTKNGMFHFNGSGSCNTEYWNKMEDWINRPGWRLTKYYIEIPWEWVKYILTTR